MPTPALLTASRNPSVYPRFNRRLPTFALSSTALFLQRFGAPTRVRRDLYPRLPRSLHRLHNEPPRVPTSVPTFRSWIVPNGAGRRLLEAIGSHRTVLWRRRRDSNTALFLRNFDICDRLPTSVPTNLAAVRRSGCIARWTVYDAFAKPRLIAKRDGYNRHLVIVTPPSARVS
jgi:hypothetical protein